MAVGQPTLNVRRAQNIAAYLAGPAIIAPLWVTATVYVAGNVVSLTNGQHIICSVGGTSGGAIPVLGSTVLNGRPIVDNTVTWYPLQWAKSASDVGAPTISSGANAAAVGLTETQTNVAGLVDSRITPFSARLHNNGNAGTRHFQLASGLAALGGNSTADATAEGFSALYAYNSQQWDMEFYVTDHKFGITIHNSTSPVYVEIDGQMIQGNPLPSSGASGWCLAFDYNGVLKRRLVRISDTQVGAQMRGVALSQQGYFEASDSVNDCMLLVGDSIFNTIIPAVTTPMMSPVGFWLKRLLGLSSVVNMSIGGIGYVSNVANSFSCQTMLGNSANQTLIGLYAPSHVVIAPGYNDFGQPWAVVGPAALATWNYARALLPDAKITITDGFPQAQSATATYQAQAANLKALYATWGDTNSRFIQAVGPSSSTAWVQGTGNAGAALSAGSACDVVGTDAVHPSPGGSFFLAQRLAAAIQLAWNGNY